MVKIEKLDLLIAVYIFCVAVSELMGAKTFPILTSPIKLNASVAIFVVPIIFSINDVITEVLGKARARSVVWSGLIVILLIFLFSLLATFLPPSSRFVGMEKAYDAIFTYSARIALASLVAFALSDFLDVYIFAKMRENLGKKALWFRNNLSNFISQFVDTTIFITLAFYALDKPWLENAGFLWSIILPYWLLKTFMSLIETPFVYLGVNWLRDKK